MVTMALRASFSPESSIWVSSFSRYAGEAAHLALQIGVDVLAFAREFEQRVEVGSQAGDLGVLGDLLFQALAILHDLLAFFGVRPEVGRVDLFFGLG